jgi:perosamine synthetase
MRIPWSNFHLQGAEEQYLLDALKSGWVSGGSYVDRTEAELNTIFPNSQCLLVSNGTSALQLAFQTLNVQAGDEVIVPGFCFQAATNVLLQLGATPVFSDVDSLAWNQTLDSIHGQVTKKTVGVVVVHNYGRAAAIQEITEWAKSRGLWVIEDCAEAWFTRSDSRLVGQFGTLATFSMHATKSVSSGEGGVVLVNDSSLLSRALLLRSHGMNRDKNYYFHEIPGNNYRLSNLLAAVALAQLEQRKNIEERQKTNFLLLKKLLSKSLHAELQGSMSLSDDAVWAPGLLVNFKALRINRPQFMGELAARGIEARPGFWPAFSLPYVDDSTRNALPVCDRISRDIIVLPCTLHLDKRKAQYIATCVQEIIDKHLVFTEKISFLNLKDLKNPDFYLSPFLKDLGNDVSFFRYFRSRSFDSIRSHDLSILLMIGSKHAGYCHLEKHDSRVWLGVAVIEKFRGQGIFHLLITRALEFAITAQIPSIHLRVDRINIRAIKAYREYGFSEILESSTSESILMKRSCYQNFL